MFYHWEQTTPGSVFLRQSLGNGEWQEITWSQFADRVRRLASFIYNHLEQRGLSSGSRVSVWSTNTVEWIIADFAISLSGHINVPLYPTQDQDSARYILSHAEVELIFLGETALGDGVLPVLPKSATKVALNKCNDTVANQCDFRFPQLIEAFEPYPASPIPNERDLFSIMYSSGTTGSPKGVMLHQLSPALAAESFARWLSHDESESGAERPRLFSYLPLAHALERMLLLMPGLYHNAMISVSAGPEHMPVELSSVQPHVFLAVPRIWSKLKEAISAQISPATPSNMAPSEKRALIYQVGLGSARRLMTGAAPLAQDVHAWYLSLGLHLCEGYAMTECAGGGVSWQSEDPPIPGCVGTPMCDTEVAIAEDGEVCLKSKALMLGYFKEDQKTEQVFSNGWYHTGDQGRLDDQGRLWLSGRLGEVFKTSKGKFVAPSQLESRFGFVQEASQWMAFGHGEDQPKMLCTLSATGQSSDTAEVESALRNALERVNPGLSRHEQISQIIVIQEEWTTSSGLLTPTLKMKRKQIAAKYASRIKQAAALGDIVW